MLSAFDKKTKISAVLAFIGIFLASLLLNLGLSASSNFTVVTNYEWLANSLDAGQKEKNSGKVRLIMSNGENSTGWVRAAGDTLNRTTTIIGDYAAYMEFQALKYSDFQIDDTQITLANPINTYGFTSTSPNVDRLNLSIQYGEITDAGYNYLDSTDVTISESLAKIFVDRGIAESSSALVGKGLYINDLGNSLKISAIVGNGFVGNDYASDDIFIFSNYGIFSGLNKYQNLNLLIGSDYYTNISLCKRLLNNYPTRIFTLSAPNNEWIVNELASLSEYSFAPYLAIAIGYCLLNLTIGFLALRLIEKFKLNGYRAEIFLLILFVGMLSGVAVVYLFNYSIIAGIHISTRIAIASITEAVGAILLAGPILLTPKEEPTIHI